MQMRIPYHGNETEVMDYSITGIYVTFEIQSELN